MERTVDDVMSLDERYELMYTKGITLNGKPATISGAKLLFPQVAALDGSCNAEWNWTAIKHIITNNGGCFYTSEEARLEAKVASQRASKPTKPKQKAERKAPVLDFDEDQLNVLLQAAYNEVTSMRSKLNARIAANDPATEIVEYRVKLQKLEVAIRKLQASLNYLTKFY